jgi:6-phosphogluconolactonase (cycloisomerase 2 family)
VANKHLPLVLALQLLLALCLGCGSSHTMPPPPPPVKAEFLYMLNFLPPPGGEQLTAFKLDPTTGVLASPTTTAVNLAAGLAVDPSAQFLYVSDPNFVTPSVDIFAIDSKSGALTPDGAFVLTTICPLCAPVTGPGALAMDPQGHFLYYGSNTFGFGLTEVLGGLSVTAGTGALNLVAGSPFSADDVPFYLQVHPGGHFLYTVNTPNPPDFTVSGVSAFSIDPGTGALAPLPGSPFSPPLPADLAGFAIHPSGKYLYVSTAKSANGILAWSIDAATGTLSELPASPFAPGTSPVGIAIHPSGKFLYTANPLSGGGVFGFTIDNASGALTPMAGSPFDMSARLGDCTIDPSGRFLLAADATNKALVIFSIDAATGALSQAGSPTPVAALPFVMVMTKAPQ